MRLGAGLDQLEIDVGHLLAEAEQIDDRNVVDRDHCMGIADAEMADRPQRIRADSVPIEGFFDGRDRAHVDRCLDDVGIVGGVERDKPLAGVGEDVLRNQVATAASQRLGEATDAISAHLGRRPVGVVQRHAGGEARLALPHQQSIGADAAPTIAQAPGEGRQIVDVRVEHDEEVVAQSVMFRQFEVCHARSNTGSAVATGSSSIAIQRMRGSRRNHRS